MPQSQYLDSINDIISERITVFKENNSITHKNTIPDNGNFPLKNNQWLKIKEVICVYVDMRNSTKLSATNHEKSTASVYELFTGSAVRIFHEFEAKYIDVKGDGVFALFNKNEVFRALTAAVSFKTFAELTFKKLVNEKIDNINIGFHMGIDQKTVLVKQIGLKDDQSRDSRKNEVWAGKPINMAAKLAARSNDNELWVSDRYYKQLNNDLVVKSCGCSNGKETNEKQELWDDLDVSGDNNFDFDKVYILKSIWCNRHGKEWCEEILKLDNE